MHTTNISMSNNKENPMNASYVFVTASAFNQLFPNLIVSNPKQNKEQTKINYKVIKIEI